MNLLLIPEKQSTYQLSKKDPRLDHVRGILRLGLGDCFDIGVINGPLGKATIIHIDELGLTLENTWLETPPELPPIHLLIGLPRPATAQKILTDATTLGAIGLHFFQAKKSDPAYAKSKLWQSEHYHQYLQLGAEQAFSTHLPIVTINDSLENAIQQLPAVSQRIALDVYEGTLRFGSIEKMIAPLAIAIGPERGWHQAERVLFREQQFQLAHFSERVLRVETAVITALAIIQARLGFI